jgi:hypothetical protein
MYSGIGGFRYFRGYDERNSYRYFFKNKIGETLRKK